MFFCQKCRNFSSVDRCQFCGAKKLREAQENDPIYLTTQKSFVYAGMLQEALKKNNIPVICQEKHGGILKFLGGFGVEEFTFYVPFGSYEKAKEILSELFKHSNIRLAKNSRSFKKGKKHIKCKTAIAKETDAPL